MVRVINKKLFRLIIIVFIEIFLCFDLSYAGNAGSKTTLSPQLIISKPDICSSFFRSSWLTADAEAAAAFAGICLEGDSFYLTIHCKGNIYCCPQTFSKAKKGMPEAIKEYVREMKAQGKPMKIHGVVIEGQGLSEEEKAVLGSNFWLNHDIVPVKVFESVQGSTPEEISQNAAMIAAGCFDVDEVDLVMHKVRVDESRKVHVNPLVTLKDYEQVSQPEKWQTLLRFSEQAKEKDLNIVFVNSTAQGGGVALMRHALMRLYELLSVDAHWLVMELDMQKFADIPQITKKKMHNALQNTNVPGFDSRLTSHDKKRLQEWTEYNFKLMEPRLKAADVVIIDDYQPSGLIPLIKKYLVPMVKKRYPDIKIIYRSHIQIRSELTDLPVNDPRSTRSNWEYILGNLWDAEKEKFYIDAFVTHPVDAFIPEDIRKHEKIIIKKGAGSDISKKGRGGFDGLNKYRYFSEEDKQYYLAMFNKVLRLRNQKILQISDLNTAEDALSAQQKHMLALLKKDPRVGITGRDDPRLKDFLEGFQGEPLDADRPYILQVCRFDPAKGILDLLKAYKVFRDKLKQDHPEQEIPQLVIAGHGAIDDPEGMPLYNEYLLEAYLEYKELFKDIKMARIGHNDQILGVLGVNAWAGTQLSIAEGYEIKISELGSLGIPMVITDLPGPLDQATAVIKGANKIIGSTFVVGPKEDDFNPEYGDEKGDSQQTKIANRLYYLFKNKEFYELIRANARGSVRDDVDTVQNAIDWLWMALEAVDNEDGIAGYGRRIVDLIQENPRIPGMIEIKTAAQDQAGKIIRQRQGALLYEQAI